MGSGRLGHIDGSRRVGHIPRNGISQTNYAYGFTDLVFWLDAGKGLNTSTDLAAVSSWVDVIRNWEFTQATGANQPRLKASNANFNNWPTVEFFDTARFMDSTRGGLPIGALTTVCFVAKYDTINTLNVVLGSTTVAGSMGMGGTAATGPYYGNSGVSVITSGTTASTAAKIVVITASNIIVNGASEYAGTITGFPDWTSDRLGRRVGVTTHQLRGHIAEILIFNYKMSSSDCVLLSDRINSKYSLY